MHVLIGIALKSLLIAGISLGLLELMKRRSAAERSWVAHIGLLALVLLAVAPLALPNWDVEAPALLGSAQPDVATPAPVATTPAASEPAAATTASDAAIDAVIAKAAAKRPALSATAATMALYAVPAAILLFITFLALARLVTLRARADVLVDGHWLSALARAQRRMGFKHGTALLTSDELASPISWGLMRPVIVLNTRAVEASGEAEAIIAHELAHVARMDWVKLLLARLATALFWFNPLVWILAREAHQLREEAADDAVLAADIADTDYAQLLVGVARHDCPGLLLGAHGVAPSKNSLARRVARVLDGKSVRGPVARSFGLGVFVGAVLVAAPLAALTLTPGGAKKAAADVKVATAKSQPLAPYYPARPEVPTDLPRLIADGVSTAVTAVAPNAVEEARQARLEAITEARQARLEAIVEARQAKAEAVTEARQAAAEARAEAHAKGMNHSDVDQIIAMRAAGVSADYVNAMRAASPALRNLDPADFTGIKSLGVTPQYVRELVAAGLRNLDADDLATAKSVGITGEYARGLSAAGVRPDIDDFVQLRATGVPVSYVVSIRKTGRYVDAEKLVEMWAVGVKPADMAVVPRPPKAPRPPRAPKADPAPPSPNWDPTDPDG